MHTVIGDLLSEVAHLDERIKQYDVHIRSMARDCTLAQRLMQLPGVGETTSTALVAMIGNASDFDTVANWPPGSAWCRAVQLDRQDTSGTHHEGG